MPRKNKTLEKTASGRQGLDWTKPKSFETAAKRIAKAYNSFVTKNIAENVREDQLENIKAGLGYMKNPETGKKTLSVFDKLYTMGKDGKLKVNENDEVTKIYEAQAKANKSKVVAADATGNTGKVIADKSKQRIRTLYESTPTATKYLADVTKSVQEGYSEFSLDEAEREAFAGSIKKTAANLQKQNPNVNDKEAYNRAKQIVTATKEAVQKELDKRANFNKEDINEMTKLFKNISDAINSGELEGLERDRAFELIHHGGYQSTYAEINELQGIFNMF